MIEAAGYSKRSLPQKLGYKAGQRVAFIGLPEGLAELRDAVAFGEVLSGDWRILLPPSPSFDAIHAFTSRAADLDELGRMQGALKRDGMIWISWPKKAAKVPTDMAEDLIRAAALRLDLVDVKVAAVDAVWSGLKLVIRKERR